MKNKKVFKIALYVGIVLIIGVTGFEIYNRNNKSLEIYNDLISQGYEEIKIDGTKKLESIFDGESVKFEEGMGFTQDFHVQLKSNDISFSLVNDVFNYDYKYTNSGGNLLLTKRISIENVDKIKYYKGDDDGLLRIFVFTTNSEIWFMEISGYDDYDFDSPNFVNVYNRGFNKYDKGKVVDLKGLHLAGSGLTFFLEGEEEKYYDLHHNAVDKDTYYYNYNVKSMESVLVTTDRKIKLNGQVSNVIFKNGLYYGELGNLKYIVSPDNYLYDLSLKKVSDQRISNILVNTDDTAVIFEDGSYKIFEYTGLISEEY